MRRCTVLGLTLLSALLAVPPAALADKGGKHGHRHERERVEYRDEDCRYRYREDKHGRREELKCKSRGHASGPPPWAPAHGYRSGEAAGPGHGDRDYESVSESVGIPGGTCNREALAGAIGGALGGVLGSRVGDGDGRVIATIAGTVIGYLIGSHVGRSMDEMDRQCTGQTLERAADRQTVAWRNPDTAARYEVTPLRTFSRDGAYCRDYVTVAEIGGRAERVHGTACRGPDGTWERVPG